MTTPESAAAARALDRDRYMNLATFRRSGAVVETPVWFAEAQGRLYVFTASDAGKVKRLRNSPRSRVAPCSARGRVTGKWLDAETRIVHEGETVETAYRALRAKYGVQMWITDALSRLSGRYQNRSILEVELV